MKFKILTSIKNGIRQDKLISSINLIGLTLSLTCSILLLIWVRDELNFDTFHTNTKTLYKVLNKVDIFNDGEPDVMSINPYPLNSYIKSNFPEVSGSTNYLIERHLISYQTKKFERNWIGFVNNDFLKMFDFPVIEGKMDNFFSDPSEIYITEGMSKKYFENINPIGKVIVVENEFQFIVAGILKSIPDNSSLKFDFLVSANLVPKIVSSNYDRWDNLTINTFIQLSNNTNPKEFERKIKDLVPQNGGNKTSALFLQPIKDIHLSQVDSMSGKGDKTLVGIFSILAFLILIIAIINFTNLSTAKATRRAMEIGLRKVVGATKIQLFSQFTLETIALSFVCTLIALLIVMLLLPTFNQLVNKNILINQIYTLGNCISYFGVSVFVGILAGTYPSFVLSSFKPINVLKKDLSLSMNDGGFLRKSLTTLQISVSIGLLIFSIIVIQQIKHMKTADLGFNKEHLVYIRNTGNLYSSYNLFRNELIKNPSIKNVAGASSLPGYGGRTYANSNLDWQGKGDKNVVRSCVFVDNNYLDLLGIKVISGRNFSPEYPSDKISSRILNETIVSAMALDSPVGTHLVDEGKDVQVIGVVKDFHIDDMSSPIEPLMLRLSEEESYEYTIIKLQANGSDIEKVTKYIEGKFNELNPNYPFNLYFFEETLQRQYESMTRFSQIINYFTIFLIIVSCMGFFGLIAFSTEQRLKEMSIRKVLGASMGSLYYLLQKDFLIIYIFSCLISWPIIYFIAKNWLHDFAFRVDINVWPFIFAGLITIIILQLIINQQIYRVKTLNPVGVLRNE